MHIQAYLNFNGNCEEAMRFYERALGGKAELMRFTGSPMEQQVPAEWREKILHGRLVVEGQTIMASDAPPGRYESPRGISISVGVNDMGRAEGMFKALSEGGKVIMPFGKTFWAKGFGMAADKYGVQWMVSCE